MLLSHSHVYHSHVCALSWLLLAPIRNIAHPFRQNNEVELLLRHFNVHLYCTVCHSRPNTIFTFLFDRVFRRCRCAHYRLTSRPAVKQPLAAVFHPFCRSSVTFIATVSHIHIELKFCQTSPLGNKWPPMTLTGPPFYYRRRTRFNLCIPLLLIIGELRSTPTRHRQ